MLSVSFKKKRRISLDPKQKLNCVHELPSVKICIPQKKIIFERYEIAVKRLLYCWMNAHLNNYTNEMRRDWNEKKNEKYVAQKFQ